MLEPKEWVGRYGNYLLNFAFLRVQDRAVAEDLVQDTFLSALKARNQFKGASTEKTWLTSILRNKILDYFKKASTRMELNEAARDKAWESHFFREDDGHWEIKNGPADWDDQPGSKEFGSIFMNCLDKLAKKSALVFSMKVIDETPSEEICKELNISSSNFWVLMHRAKLQLRECLEKNWIR